MYNLPMNPLIVGDLQQCFSCCQNTSQPVCNATDSLGLPMYFNYQGNVSTPNGACVFTCCIHRLPAASLGPPPRRPATRGMFLRAPPDLSPVLQATSTA